MEKDEIRKILGDKDNKILRLEKELERMKRSLRNEDYGLAWIDVPEAFEDDVENKLPTVVPVSKRDVKSNDTKPAHLLIEGENYHALTCLNYTHKGKIDLIYIDPPYNTGSDGFRYKDKRILDKYPDGTEVPTDHPLRHSYWLSFMRKRLELAKWLLKEEGLIYISIDYREAANLELLLNSVFGETNRINDIAVQMSQLTGLKMKHVGEGNKFPKIKETLFIYAKNAALAKMQIPKVLKSATGKDGEMEKYLKYYSNIIENPTDPCEEWSIIPVKKYIEQNGLKVDVRKVKELNEWKIKNADRLVYRTNNDVVKRFVAANPKAPAICEVISPDGEKYIKWADKRMLFLSDYMTVYVGDIWYDISTINLNKETFGLPTFTSGQKPIKLIKRCLESIPNKNAVVLDFFAGSGTTGHAVLDQNKVDEGNRQFILVTNNEGGIVDNFCLPRMQRALSGYKDFKGYGGSLKYYRIGFVGEHSVLNTNDKDKLALAYSATELLAIAENTLENVEKNSHFEVFENKDRYTAIYFKESFDKFDDFTKKVLSLKKPTTVYIFSWENDPFVDEFEDNPRITVKTIPEPILEIYRRIHNL